MVLPGKNPVKILTFIQDSVVDTLSAIGFMSEAAARNWCEKAAEPYAISIEDFAKRVRTYLESKEKNHHIVFLVDEVGQYIGEDSNLILNLQTVTEDLGRECKGKAWIVATSQQDIDSITKVKGRDFSKIQGRFDTRLSLSSANVDEVIKERILKKTDTAAQTLRLLFEQKATDINNRITFTGAEKKLYATARDFAEVYPFVPYQFNLLASVLTSIRTHGASGKHLSEGERSMLALFKESATGLKEAEVGVLVPFHRFYDALENFLDHSHRSVIIRAYDNSFINPEQEDRDVFAINVLKVLFMIKYVFEIEANIDNITSLMFANIDDERTELKERVEDALRILTREVLVQKNGSIYMFLSNEEQEINKEIENENVEMAEVINKVPETIFEDICKDKRYRYPMFNGRYGFSFNQKVDDRFYKPTQSYDIGLHILTPWYDGSVSSETLRMTSGQGKEVLVVLPNDDAFLTEMQVYIKIERFLQKNTSTQLSKYETIKEAKRVEMRERYKNAKLYLEEALKEADIYVNGDIAHLSSKEVMGRINEAIGRLVQTVYHKLPYIDAVMGETDIRKMLRGTNQSLTLEGGIEANQHALNDLQSFIILNSRGHMKTSMKTVKDRFMKAPYGYVEDDIHWLVARLFKRGDLSFTVNGEVVSLANRSEEEIISFITKRAYADKLLMEEHIRVADREKKAVRDVMQTVFHTSSSSEDEDTIMQNFQQYAKSMISEVERLEVYYQQHPYPGKRVLADGKKLMFAAIQPQAPIDFFATIYKKSDDFKDFAEDYEPIKAFFSGEQQKIFTHTLELLAIYDDSKTYIVDPALEEIVAQMRSIVRQERPYGNIPKLPDLRERFMTVYLEILETEQTPVLDSIDQAMRRVLDTLSGKEYEEQKRGDYYERFDEIREGSKHCNNVSLLRSFGDKANALKLRLLDEMDALDSQIAQRKAEDAAKQAAEESERSGSGSSSTKMEQTPVCRVRKTKRIPIKQMTGTASWRLESTEDIDKCLAQLRERLTVQLDADTIVNIEF